MNGQGIKEAAQDYKKRNYERSELPQSPSFISFSSPLLPSSPPECTRKKAVRDGERKKKYDFHHVTLAYRQYSLNFFS